MMNPLNFFRRKKAQLLVDDGRIGKTFNLFENEITIGRLPFLKLKGDGAIVVKKGKNIFIANVGTTKNIDPVHAKLHWDKEKKQYVLKNISSAGTVVNGKKIQEVLLNDKDQFILRKMELHTQNKSIGKLITFQILYNTR